MENQGNDCSGPDGCLRARYQRKNFLKERVIWRNLKSWRHLWWWSSRMLLVCIWPGEPEGHSHTPISDRRKQFLSVSGGADCILTGLTQIQIPTCFFKDSWAWGIVCAQSVWPIIILPGKGKMLLTLVTADLRMKHIACLHKRGGAQNSVNLSSPELMRNISDSIFNPRKILIGFWNSSSCIPGNRLASRIDFDF